MRWQRHHIEIGESILTVLVEKKFFPAAVDSVRRTRGLLRQWISLHPEFAASHDPLDIPDRVPESIKRMYLSAEKSGVGPMAAVAGMVAWECLDSLLKAGAPEAVVDNGGDIALFVTSPVLVGLYCGPGFPVELALEALPRPRPFGIATSSGTVGHSHSYGKADAALVVSFDLVTADAAATALGNRVLSKKDLTNCFDVLADIPEIEGGLAVLGRDIALWGSLPALKRIPYDTGLITRGCLPGRRTTVLPVKGEKE